MDLPLLCLITRGYFWKLKRIFDHALLRARVFWTWLKLLGVRWVFQSKNMVVGTASHTDSTIRCFKPRNMGLIVKHGFATIQFGNGTNCDSIRGFAKVGECGNIRYIYDIPIADVPFKTVFTQMVMHVFNFMNKKRMLLIIFKKHIVVLCQFGRDTTAGNIHIYI